MLDHIAATVTAPPRPEAFWFGADGSQCFAMLHLPSHQPRKGIVICNGLGFDGVLAEFASVVNAVECALAFQETMTRRNAAVEPERRMQSHVHRATTARFSPQALAPGGGVTPAACCSARSRAPSRRVAGPLDGAGLGACGSACERLPPRAFGSSPSCTGLAWGDRAWGGAL